jgi:hypothetical protein
VNLESISTSYVVPVGVDDEVEMNHVDTLVAPAADVLARTSWSSSSRMLPRLVALKCENSWVFVPFMLFCVRIRATRLYVINICCLKHLDVCKLKHLLFISIVVVFCLSQFLR